VHVLFVGVGGRKHWMWQVNIPAVLQSSWNSRGAHAHSLVTHIKPWSHRPTRLSWHQVLWSLSWPFELSWVGRCDSCRNSAQRDKKLPIENFTTEW